MKQVVNIGGFVIRTSPFNEKKFWLQCNDGEGMEITEEKLNEKLNSVFWELF